MSESHSKRKQTSRIHTISCHLYEVQEQQSWFVVIDFRTVVTFGEGDGLGGGMGEVFGVMRILHM